MKIKNYDQWLIWKDIDGRKIPFSVDNMISGSTKKSDFVSWEAVKQALEDVPDVSGPAFCFTSDDPFGGIDLDNCVAFDGKYSSPLRWVDPIIERFAGCYMELSPSMRGIKIFGRFRKPDGMPCVALVPDGGSIEVYDHGRFFTVTGCQPDWLPAGEDNIDVQDAVDWLYDTYYPRRNTFSGSIQYFESLAGGGDLWSRAQAYVESCEPAGLNQRNLRAFKLAGHLASMCEDGEFLSAEQIFDLLRPWNQMAASGPLPDKELKRCISNAMNAGTPRDIKDSHSEAPSVDLTAIFTKTDKVPVEASECVTEAPGGSYDYSTPFAEIHDDWESHFMRKEGPVVWHCGFPLEIGPGSLCLIGGGPATGKTTFVCQIVSDILRKYGELRALVVSVEVDGRHIWNRLISRSAGINARRLLDREGMTSGEDEHALEVARKLASDIGRRMHLLKRPNTIAQVYRAAQQCQPDLVVLDYIQRIAPVENYAHDLRKQIAQCMDAARSMCQAGAAVIAVSSLARPDKRSSEYKQVYMTSFSGSAELEYGPDEAWGMTKDSETGLIEMSCVKARYREAQNFQMRQDDTLEFKQIFVNYHGDTVDVEQDEEGVVSWQF